MADPAEQLTHLLSLAQIPAGSRARILMIRGGRDLTRRLLGLGLRSGSVVELLQHRGRGVVLAVGDTRIALGGGIAEKLLAEQLNGDDFPP